MKVVMDMPVRIAAMTESLSKTAIVHPADLAWPVGENDAAEAGGERQRAWAQSSEDQREFRENETETSASMYGRQRAWAATSKSSSGSAASATRRSHRTPATAL